MNQFCNLVNKFPNMISFGTSGINDITSMTKYIVVGIKKKKRNVKIYQIRL